MDTGNVDNNIYDVASQLGGLSINGSGDGYIRRNGKMVRVKHARPMPQPYTVGPKAKAGGSLYNREVKVKEAYSLQDRVFVTIDMLCNELRQKLSFQKHSSLVLSGCQLDELYYNGVNGETVIYQHKTRLSSDHLSTILEVLDSKISEFPQPRKRSEFHFSIDISNTYIGMMKCLQLQEQYPWVEFTFPAKDNFQAPLIQCPVQSGNDSSQV